MSWISAPAARTIAEMRRIMPNVMPAIAAWTALLGSHCASAGDLTSSFESRGDDTWRCVVLNGGQPRSGRALATSAVSFVQPVSYSAGSSSLPALSQTDRASWSLQLGMVRPPHVYRTYFGPTRGTPIAGDFNGDGLAELGMFVAGNWYLDLNGNSEWDSGDLYVRLGDAGYQPVVGDWDGDGKDDVGVVRHDLHRVPVVGDFDGDGRTDRGYFADGVWTLHFNGRDSQSETQTKTVLQLGVSGDRPVVGDFNRDGRDDLGIYRRGQWHVDTSGDRRLGDNDLRLTLGNETDVPVVGDWDGDGRDQIGIVHRGDGS